ncbi:MAG: FAD:protein FMN transferase [Eudoraea sp.]|uniref:FAD:protein FMN transferase n=1 Tax=Eudoraea sp. TaxID=1979955 RepID=UPI00326627D9
MKSFVALLFGILTMTSVCGQAKRNVTVKRSVKLMGSPFEFTVVTQNEEIGYINLEEAIAEVKRIERLISSWDPESETSEINRNAGSKPVKVSFELYKLIERSIQISEITDGAFDITVAAMEGVWKFDGSMSMFPTPEQISRAVSKVGYKKIILNSTENTVFLKEKGMKIGFGAIGKGYAADQVKELLVSKQVPAGMINASGDISTWGTKASGEKWLIGVDHPRSNGKIFTWIPLIESSVSITGNLDRYITFNGKKYPHYIDPISGYPTTGISKVTIFAKSAELCDALATAVYILGKEKGISLINQLGDTEVIILDNYNQMFHSHGIILDTVE